MIPLRRTQLAFTLLFGIGVAFTDFGQVIDAISLIYVLIVCAVVAGAAFGACLVGKLVGFYPIESAITAGLCMANMGGTGDVTVLSAARRVSLMPLAQVSSRLGGALILLVSSVLVPLSLPERRTGTWHDKAPAFRSGLFRFCPVSCGSS